MKNELKKLIEQYENLIKIDGFDDCIVGVVNRFNQEPILCYDYNKVITKLSKDMSYEDAIEYFDFNIIGAYVGEQTPCFLDKG